MDKMKKDESRTKRDLVAELEELRGLIAHHRETEARLRETEELYRNLADSSPVGLYLLVQGKFHFLNALFERSTGYRTDELIGKDALFMVHPEDREKVRRDAIEMLRGKRTTPYEFRIITKDGRSRWMLGTVASIPFWGERAVLGNLMDISEQKEARQKIDELKTLEASILDALPVAVIGLRERQIISANRAVEAIFGWKPEEIIGRNTRLLYRSDDEFEEIGRRFYPILEKQRTRSEEFSCRHRDGHDILCFVSTSRIGMNLQEKRIVATYEDITERKQAEAALKGSEERLRVILEGSPTPTFVIDRSHRVIGWNKALEELTGVRSDDVIGTGELFKDPLWRKASYRCGSAGRRRGGPDGRDPQMVRRALPALGAPGGGLRGHRPVQLSGQRAALAPLHFGRHPGRQGRADRRH